MALHVIAYSQSVAEGGVYTAIDGVSDPTLKVVGKYIYIPTLNRVLRVGVLGGSTITDAYLDSPSLRARGFQDLVPLEAGLVFSDSPRYADFSRNPLVLVVTEGLRVFVKAKPATAEQHSVIVILSDSVPVPTGGEIMTVQATASASVPAGVWTNTSFSFRQDLPAGTYNIVGARVEGVNLIAFRLIIPGSFWRPGGFAVQTPSAKDPEGQRNGEWGVWGSFHTTAPPTIDLLSSGPNESQKIYLDLIKVG